MTSRLLLSALLLAACGTDPTPQGGAPDAGGGGPDGGGGGPDAAVPDGYRVLIDRPWSLPAGATDTYRCARFTVTEDTYVTNIIAEAPLGTHHTVLSISDGNTAGPDGDYNCDVSELGMVMLYASGVGTSPLDFPAGVGVKIAAGTQVHLNLHLFNATDNALSGTSGIMVKSQATPPAQLAEMVFAGTYGIFLPSNNTPITVQGGCNESAPYTLFALWPHMHQLGTHMKVEHIRSGQSTVLHDDAFDFGEQYYYLQNPTVSVQTNDAIHVSCTFVNNTGRLVMFGESSTSEMCFAGLYRYPARDTGLFDCVSNLGPPAPL